ncbi:protein translocase subunit SecF [bacterium]|nr:protein translocase subunit SecF [bacterium]
MTTVKIIEKKNLWFSVSALLITIGFFLMGLRFIKNEPVLNFGSDFAGGSTMVLRFDGLAEKYRHSGRNKEKFQIESSKFIAEVRRVLEEFNLGNSSIQLSGDQDVVIKTAKVSSDQSLKIRGALTSRLGANEVLEIDYVGPSMGKELRNQAMVITVCVAIALMAYISWRFEFSYGWGALGATLHDALIMMSLASILGIEINSAFVAALLTILGYSINDTIVIFDRIRDNINMLKNQKQAINLVALVNQSIRETLGRTINTVLTVVIVLVALLIFGGETIRPFCIVLLMGTITGTYSSIFIASPVMIMGTSLGPQK